MNINDKILIFLKGNLGKWYMAREISIGLGYDKLTKTSKRVKGSCNISTGLKYLRELGKVDYMKFGKSYMYRCRK